MASPAPATQGLDDRPLGRLGLQERAVLAVLVHNGNRVIGRRELSRQAGLADLSERRIDGVLVGIRRVLGPDCIVTVRSRGWMLSAAAMPAAHGVLAAN